MLAALSAVALAGFAKAAGAQAPFATTKSTVDSALQGVTGGIAINKFGDVFQASTWEGKVYKFPANGGAPVVVFQYGSDANYSGKGLGGVAVDANQNLYITTIYVGGQTQTDSAIYELPYVNGSYPGTFTLNAPVAKCSANPTAVCSWGNYLSAAGYYYQGWDIAFDGAGTGYFVTLFDNNHANDIYACNAACEARSQSATVLVSNLPNPVLSIAADAAGDVFYADGSSSVFEIAAGTTTPVAVGTGFNTTVGVAVDRAGNLFVSDSVALYEIARSSAGAYGATSEIVALAGASKRGYNGGGVAVDLHGNLFAASGYTNLFKFTVNQAVFAAAATNSGSSTAAVTVTLNQVASGLTATPIGGQAGDFSASAITCASGSNAGSTCSFTGTFTPTGVGLRKSTLDLTDSAGNSTSVTVSGVGQGGGLTVDPGTLTSIATGLQAVGGTAVDAAGNVFVADTAANAVYEYVGGTGTAVPFGSGYVAPTGVAVDSVGNLLVADAGGSGSATGRVVKVAAAGGAPSLVASGLGSPQGITLDGTGTLYVADSVNKNIFVLPQSQFGQAGGATFGTGLSAPSDVAVDSLGNLYVADPDGNQVVEISQEGQQTAVGSGFSGPTGVALDASGSVLVADHGNKRLVRVPNEAGVLNANDEVSINTAIAGAYAVRTAPNSSLVVTDTAANTLQAVDRTTGASIFSSVNVGTTSAAQTVYLSSEGNLPLALSSPLFAPPSGEFALAQATPACTPGTSLNAGSVCELAATFAPTAKGFQTASVPFTTSAQNTAMPSLTLQGTGLFLATATVTLVQTSPAAAPAYGQTVTLTATAGGTVADGGTPTGTISLVLDGSLQPPVALVNGSAALTVAGLSGGAHTLEADYSGDTNYAASQSAVLTITVAPSSSATTLSIAADQATPLSSASGHPVTFSSTLTPGRAGFFSGTVNFVSGSTVLASAPISGPDASGNYAASVTTTTIPAGSYQVAAVFSGNANYAGSSSPIIALTIVPTATIVVVPSPGAITTSATAPGSTLLTVTPYAGFQGAVDFACTGLPANAVCQFNPGTVTLIADTGTGPFSVPPVTTKLTVLVNQAPVVTPTGIWPWASLFLLFVLVRLRHTRRAVRSLAGTLAGLCLLAALGIGITGCGSSNNLATPAGTSTVTVTATATPSTPGTPTPTPSTLPAVSVSSTFAMSVTVK